MIGPKDVYRRECEALDIIPNSGLLRMLPDTTVQIEGVSVMHFGRNYLGDRGILPLLEVIIQAKSLHTLNLRDNGIGNDGVRALCRALRHHPSLRVLELSGNPFTYLAARQLVHLCEDSDTITFIGMENTLMTEPLRVSILHRLEKALKHREDRRFVSTAREIYANSPAIAGLNTSAVGPAVNSSSFGSATSTPIAASHVTPIIAEDESVIRKLSGLAAVDPASLFPQRNSRNNFLSGEMKGENSLTQNEKSGANSIHSLQRPPLATPPSQELKTAVPEWFDMDDDSDGADNVEVEIDQVYEDEPMDDPVSQLQEDMGSVTEPLSTTVKEETVRSCGDSSVALPPLGEERCTDSVPDADTLKPSSVVNDPAMDWYNEGEEGEKKQEEQMNKSEKKDFLDLLFGDDGN
ncbi:putative calpain-like cysteine peptidase [Trypanosoma theileri]|uniref:Putative calpain-like cysteine peptidase n=1 Tax=Trypanosoma theileri TaxID=67003 RepID=A0A1X0NZH1_9TRYP|nr:putative calpain-like cysteine peptidase [Trypanosoma theileri]ORC89540.1 putative calpain-like cysteine peptidase [Trypanosoma theileri]